MIHIVSQGESLTSIANSYGLSRELLQNINWLPNPDTLVPGQTILILYPKQEYVVLDQDTPYKIAEKNGITTTQLIQRNPQLVRFGYIFAGDTLVIEFEDEPTETIECNGYAYPYVPEEILIQSLPYLTYLTIFGYGFDLEGNLTVMNDEPLIELAKTFRTAPVMLLSSIDAYGKFNSYLASVMMKDEDLQDKLLENIIELMQKKGYVGLDIDFEYIPPEDADGYLNFLQKAVEALHPYGYFVHVDLAPKTAADQPGLLYEAHDYKKIGEIVDQVLVMSYEWGYTYGPPMAVAPINQVTRVVNFAVTEIVPEKIQMGIPNYGYDWVLPFEKGRPARSIGNVEAVWIASYYNTEILFDETAQAPFLYYTDENGTEHVVWFEDMRSIMKKFELITEKQLAGAGYWNVMRIFPQNWMLLINQFRIRKLL